MFLQPNLVRAEVEPDGTDQPGGQAQSAEAVREVGRRAAAAHLQVVDQEGQRDVGELIGDQLIGETAGEDHQVIGRQ